MPAPAPKAHLLALAERLERERSEPPPPPMNPVRAAAHLEEARRLAKEGAFGKALPFCRSAADSPRFAAEALRLKGRLEHRLGKPEKAVFTLKAALHAANDDAARVAIYEDLASLHAFLGERGEEAYYLRRAVRLAPSRHDLTARLGRAERWPEVHDSPTRPSIALP